MNRFQNDDSDMKIVDVSGNVKEAFDTLEFLEQSRTHRFNGNMSRARNLGSNIVSAFSYKAAPEEQELYAQQLGITLDSDSVLQIKLLSVFTAEYCLETYLPAALSATAITAMYDVLEDVSPDLYKAISASLAFSYYYLCVRAGGDIAGKIGNRFATLCGHSGEDAFVKLGSGLFEINTGVYRKAIDGYAFV